MYEQLIVETKAGKVRGAKQYNFEDDEFYAFRGIPYAKPPVGDLRFQDPEPVEPWMDVRDATFHGPNCAQLDVITSEVIGDEDCLYLNVYTKGMELDTSLPVMVWIHGGGFVHGHGDDSLYGPNYFMREDIVLITINYRLGALGFLNVNDEAATGNQGLKDQVMALKWVRDNISNFGGNPENVTIFGESAGSVSVHYLCISPLAKGLFHKAIAQSGVALNPWAFQTNPSERVYKLCEMLGYEVNDPKLAVQFLREADVQTLITAQENLLTKEEKIHFAFSFVPSVDSKSKNPFMPVHPDEATKQGIDVPLIIGHTNREGIIVLLELGKAHDRFNTQCKDLLHPNAVDTMNKLYQLDPENIKRLYLQNDEITDGNVDKLIDMLGDLYFVEGIHRVVKTQIQKNSSPTYFYQFTYDKETSLLKTLSRTKMSGACHADEVSFLFPMQSFATLTKQYGIPRKSWYQMAKWYIFTLPIIYLAKYCRFGYPKEGSDKYRISEQMVEMWVNFATTGKPTAGPSSFIPVHWEPVDDINSFRYLKIDEILLTETQQNLEIKYITREN